MGFPQHTQLHTIYSLQMSDQGTETAKNIAKPKEKKANQDTDRIKNTNKKEPKQEDILLESLLK